MQVVLVQPQRVRIAPVQRVPTDLEQPNSIGKVCARYHISKYPAEGPDTDPDEGLAPINGHPVSAPARQKRTRPARAVSEGQRLVAAIYRQHTYSTLFVLDAGLHLASHSLLTP